MYVSKIIHLGAGNGPNSRGQARRSHRRGRGQERRADQGGHRRGGEDGL